MHVSKSKCQMSDVRGQGHGPWRYAYCTGAVHERPPTPRGRMCVPLTCRSAWTFTSVYTSQTLTPRATPCAWEIFALRGACELRSISACAHVFIEIEIPRIPRMPFGRWCATVTVIKTIWRSTLPSAQAVHALQPHHRRHWRLQCSCCCHSGLRATEWGPNPEARRPLRLRRTRTRT